MRMFAKAYANAPMSRAGVSPGAVRRSRALGLMTAAAFFVPRLASAQSGPAPSPAPPEAAAPPAASPPQVEEAEGRERTLGNHVFLFPAHVRSSLVTSYVGLRIRLGLDTVGSLPTAIGRSDVEVVTLNEGLDVGAKITDWLGVFGVVGVRALIGTNLRALTYAGATYDVGGRAGAVVRLFRSERTGSQLSLRAGVGATRGQLATLYPIFDSPVQSAVQLLQGDLGESIRTPFTTSSYEGTVAFTQGFGRAFGVQASGAMGGSRVTTEPYDGVRKTRGSNTVNGVTYAFGVGPSIDFNALHVPIAVMPEYVITRQASTAQLQGSGSFDTRHLIAAGVYYSGRVNLQLGLLWATELGAKGLTNPLGQSDSPRSSHLQFVLRYIW